MLLLLNKLCAASIDLFSNRYYEERAMVQRFGDKYEDYSQREFIFFGIEDTEKRIQARGTCLVIID